MISGDEVRRTALSFPGTEERETWGHPTFRYGDKMFLGMDTAGTAGSLKATKEDQAALIESDPATFSKAAYVGHHGWVAVDFGRVDPGEMRELIEEAWRMTAPKRVVKAYEQDRAAEQGED